MRAENLEEDKLVALIELLGRLGASSPVQTSKFATGRVLPSLLLCLFSHPPRRTAVATAAAVAVGSMLAAPQGAGAPAMRVVRSLLPDPLVSALSAAVSSLGASALLDRAAVPEPCRGLLQLLEASVCDGRYEWDASCREEVGSRTIIDALRAGNESHFTIGSC